MIDNAILRTAFAKTCERRDSFALLPEADLILKEISEDSVLLRLWQSYQRKFDYVADARWEDVLESIRRLVDICLISNQNLN